jgi:hypothetical protein
MEFKKDITLYKAFGFALTTSGGSLGTLAGHEGEHMFRDFNITFFHWTYLLSFVWIRK